MTTPTTSPRQIFTRETVKIPSVEKGVYLDVWVYKPVGRGPFPVVVAGHGIILTKDTGLAVFGERWAANAGYASLILDYRHFGGSGGEPRNLVSLKKQLEDYRSVIKYARQRPEEFQNDKIVVMGNSLSGLSVATLVLEEDGLAGGITHCPVLDGKALLLGQKPNPRLLFWVFVDWFRSKLGLSPVYIKCFGTPNEFALMTSPTCYKGFESMFAHGTTPFNTYPNVCTPRVSLETLSATQGSRLKDAKCPLLVVLPLEDDLIPAELTRRLAKEANGKVVLVEAPGGHFDVMSGSGKSFDTNIEAQINFLKTLSS